MTEVKRTALHRRQIDAEGFLREDGLWDIEVALRDSKAYEMRLPSRAIPVGDYLHRMKLIVTVDTRLVIQDIRTEMQDTPYSDCGAAGLRYESLIGLQIKKGWLDEAKQMLGRTASCTHLTELLPVAATAAIQTIRGYKINQDTNYESIRSSQDQMMDSCYGYRKGGEAHQIFWTTSKD